MKCQWCKEEILPDEESLIDEVLPSGEVVKKPLPFHRECQFRVCCGSAGHIKKACSCYGGNEEDPPGVSKREAARAAVRAWDDSQGIVVLAA